MESRRRVTLYDQMTGGDTSKRDSLATLIFDDVVLAANHSNNNQITASDDTGRRDSLATLLFDDVVLAPNHNDNEITARDDTGRRDSLATLLFDDVVLSNQNDNPMTAGDSDTGRRDSLATLMLDDVVFSNQNTEAATASHQLGSSRTLQDIIRADNEPSNTKDRKSWKAFKDKLRLKRAGGSAHHQQNDAVNNNSNSALSQFSNPSSEESNHQQNDVIEVVTENPAPAAQEQLPHAPPMEFPFAGGDSSDEDNNSETRRAVVAGPASISLMDLLEETDGEMGLEESRYKTSDDDDEDHVDEDDGVEEEGAVAMQHNNCCVCMVRNKGAAFIPCGHTFCRVCCRELWVSRGNCPLCNNFILEILDIF